MIYKMKSIYKISLRMGVTFRDESNDGNWSMIGYNNVTVTILKSHGQIPH